MWNKLSFFETNHWIPKQLASSAKFPAPGSILKFSVVVAFAVDLEDLTGKLFWKIVFFIAPYPLPIPHVIVMFLVQEI